MRTAAAIGLALCLSFSASNAAAQAPSASRILSDIPGQQVAQTLSLITGVAISPLLGVSAVGAWQYYHASTPEQRAKLHWYANPAFWVPAMVLVFLCFLKDTAGTALPVALKKPLDVAEAIEHKISALVAIGAFIPLAAWIFENHTGSGSVLSAVGFAAADLSWLSNTLTVILAMFTFVVVFLASNAINILILLSPFTTVDAALKGFRAAVLASVVATAWINPWLGAAWALLVIFVAFLIAGWSYRLSVFGMICIWDFLTGRRKRFVVTKPLNPVFLGRKIDRVPARTCGSLSRTGGGNLVLQYRPWLVLRQKTLILPAGNYEAGRGLFYSEILRVNGDRARTMLLLPPRYSGHEEEVAKICGLASTRDVGLRAAWAWLKGMLGERQAATVS